MLALDMVSAKPGRRGEIGALVAPSRFFLHRENAKHAKGARRSGQVSARSRRLGAAICDPRGEAAKGSPQAKKVLDNLCVQISASELAVGLCEGIPTGTEW